MTINPAYLFVLNVAKRFDNAKFSQEEQVFGQESPQNLEDWKVTLSEQLPDLVIADIASHRIQNAADWLHMTGLIQKTTRIKLPQTSINETALALLKYLEELEKKRNSEVQLSWDFEHPYQELCKQIFLEAYVNADDAGKQEILGLANAISPDDMKVSTWDLRAYRIKRLAGIFFNHFVVKLSLTAVVLYASMFIVSNVIDFLFLRFPLINQAFKALAIVFLVSLSHNIYRLFMGAPLNPRSLYFFNLLQPILGVQTYLPAKISVLFYRRQDQISAAVTDHSDRTLQELFYTKGHKAFELWKRIMAEAKQDGVRRFA